MAWLLREGEVLASVEVASSWRSRTVIEAEAGAFARWNLRPGDQLEVKGDDEDAA